MPAFKAEAGIEEVSSSSSSSSLMNLSNSQLLPYAAKSDKSWQV
jgi:hypothetical protein